MPVRTPPPRDRGIIVVGVGRGILSVSPEREGPTGERNRCRGFPDPCGLFPVYPRDMLYADTGVFTIPFFPTCPVGLSGFEAGR